MFVPLPEISTATLARSGKVAGAPGLPRAPRLGAAGNGAAARAGFDRADEVDRLARPLQRLGHTFGLVTAHGQNHADPAVEGARHLFGLDVALALEERDQPRLLP